jgi:hypothetical protein
MSLADRRVDVTRGIVIENRMAHEDCARGDEDSHVIVVLGYHEIRCGRHLLSATGRAGVKRAAALDRDRPARAVIFTGWSSHGDASEADQMLEIWGGRRDVLLLREPDASNTAENAVRSYKLVRQLGGVSEVSVVCSIRHLLRVRFLFRAVYGQDQISLRYCYVIRPFPSARLLLHELCSIARMARDRDAACELLQTSYPAAEPMSTSTLAS